MTDKQLFAAIDLGSNSFHMIVARDEHGELRVIDRLRDMVRLGGGLDERGQLDATTREAALASLSRFGQRLAEIPAEQIRAVGTQTFRRLKNPAAFLVLAETALGCPIEIISGREEARLVYRGVNRGIAPAEGRRLVIDIGGGSTEVVVGEGREPALAESFPYGCVSETRQAFDNGRITPKAWRRASARIQGDLLAFQAAYRRFGWQQAAGSSGTIRAIGNIIEALESGAPPVIRPAQLDQLKHRLLEAGRVDAVNLPGLSEARRPVIAGGVLILEAVMASLGIDQLRVSPFALREGVLEDLVGRLSHDDPRDQSVQAMMERYQVDRAQAERIEAWIAQALSSIGQRWPLQPVHRDLLRWACRLHEIGLAIAHDQHHRHAAYIVEQSDMAGFSRPEQLFMATLVGGQRQRINPAELKRLPDRLLAPARHALALLRLALCLHRARRDWDSDLWVRGEGPGQLCLNLPPGWLDAHPLSRHDLNEEQRQLKRLDIELSLAEQVPAA